MKLSMNIVETEPVNYGSPRSNRRSKLHLPRKSSNAYSTRKSRARGQAGQSGEDSGRKTEGFTAGVGMTENAKRDLEII